MTPDELFTAYPMVTHATAWTEMVVCEAADPGGPSAWDELVASGLGPADVRDVIRDSVSEDDTLAAEVRERVVREMDTAEYLTYLRGKLGAM